MDQVIAAPVRKPRVATVWLGGCSGCHMSLLDMDERIIELAQRMDLVYSPIVDVKEFPEDVDATLVEGAVANQDNLEMIHKVRRQSKVVVALGDCAVSGNVTAMRNTLRKVEPVIARAYLENVDIHPRRPSEPGIVPALVTTVLPIHHVIDVDAFLPGCPPSADLIHFVIMELLEGRKPDLAKKLKFG
jgi:NAD-reducing hydrogenase small subunit